MRPLVLLALLAVAPAGAQTGAPLVLGVSDAPPFAIRGSDGTWDGLGVHLAREAALVMGREVVFREVPPDSGFAALASGRVDVLAAVVATRESEAQADLTTAYYTAPLGAVRQRSSGMWETVKRVASPTFLWVALALTVLLLLVGVAVWLIERHKNDDDFREGPAGIWDGFWWAGVTMSTIGYGDLVPTTVAGRALGLVWMVLSMGITAALTAVIVSALGLKGGSGGLRLPDDLRDQRVAVVAGSPAEETLRAYSLDLTAMPTLDAGLSAVRSDSADVLVASAPRLRSEAGGSDLDVGIEATALRPQRWALAVAEGSPLREPLSRAVLDRIGGPDWRAAIERFVPDRP